MKTMTLAYPEGLVALGDGNSDIFEHDAKWAMAAKLYEMGRLTSGQAATLAGVGRVEFLLNCHRFGVSAVDWDSDELRREFEVTAP